MKAIPLLVVLLLFAVQLPAQTPTPSPSDDYIVVAFDVKHSQMIPFSTGMTLLTAITSSGDFNEYAAQRFIYLVRGGEKQKIDLKPLRSDPTKNPKLEPWDIVYFSPAIF